MEIIYNNIFPFKGYLAMCVFPFIFVRKDARALKTTDINHEMIHGKQQLEIMVAVAVILVALALFGVLSWWWLFAIPFAFYVWYVLEWLVRIPLCGFDSHLAYRNISFEREAYSNQNNVAYLDKRKPYAFLKYINSNIN
jgi:hypothetical protein